MSKDRAEAKETGPAGRHLCVDGHRLCAIQRRRLNHRDQQDYLDRHNPKFTRMDLAVVLLVAVSVAGAVGSGLAGSRSSPPSGIVATPIPEPRYSADADEIEDVFDLRH